MTQDEIIRMAREAGLAEVVYGEENGYTTLETKFNLKKIADFAALVAANEREACAKVASSMILPDASNYPFHIAAAIRARGK